jgi:hypothetical protein
MPLPHRQTRLRRIQGFGLVALAFGLVVGCAGSTPTGPQSASSVATATSAVSAEAQSATTMSTGDGSNALPSGIEVDANPGGAIAADQSFADYSPPFGIYAVKVPDGWTRVDAETTTIFIHGYDRVRIQVTDADAGPTTGTAALQLAATGANALAFAAGDITEVHRPAGQVIRLKYQNLMMPLNDGEKAVLEQVEDYQLWKAGKLVTITLSAPVGVDNTVAWRTVTDSFRWL